MYIIDKGHINLMPKYNSIYKYVNIDSNIDNFSSTYSDNNNLVNLTAKELE